MCGGAGAMNVWTTPDQDIDGLCVYDHPFDGRVLPDASETGVPDLTVYSCLTYCLDRDFPYYGLENGDSCYCGADADRFVPANPIECGINCSGDEFENCGSAYRLSGYGPSFRPIEADKVVFKELTEYHDFAVSISVKLDDHADVGEDSNIFGFQTHGTAYPNVGSQIPSAFVTANSNDVKVCHELDGTTYCETAIDECAITPGEWFDIYVEQWCWDWDNNICWVYVYVNECWIVRWNNTPITYYNVDGIIGNTYNGTFPAASGYYKDFTFESWAEVRDAASDFVTNDADAQALTS